MKTGLSINELAAKITAQSELKQDYIAPSKALATTVDADDGVVKLIVPDKGHFPLLPVAHDQLATHTKIPRDYYKRMQTEHPTLLVNNINAWFGRFKPEDKRMVRTLGGDARALLSNKYQRIENEEIANAALPVLADLPGVQIVSSEVTDKRLYIHFVIPSVQGELVVTKGKLKVGDVVQAGGVISNSEVGLGSVSIEGLIWRLICLNGMKSGETFRRHHVGRRTDDDAALYAQDTLKADDKAILLKVRDMVRAVVDQTRFAATLAKLQDLTTGVIEGDPAKAVEVLARKVGASDTERGGILRSLIEGGDLSRWGIVNAITAQAHTAASYDRAVEFEGLGGSLVDLPASEWKEILAAA